MKLKDVRYTGVVLLLGMLLVTSACEKDEEATTATIQGQITVNSTDIWAQYQDSGEVQLTIFPEFSLGPSSRLGTTSGWQCDSDRCTG